MNLHSVQDLLAEAELKYLMQPYSQIITPQESKPIIVITQDSLNAAYLMSTKVFNITKAQFMNVCMNLKRWDNKDVYDEKRVQLIDSMYEAENSPHSVYSGRGLFSLILPPDFFYRNKNEINPNEPVVCINQGVFMSGSIDKAVLGYAHNSMIQHLNKDYGPIITANVIDNIHFIAHAWMLIHGFSIGLQDCMITSHESQAAIQDSLDKCYSKAHTIELTTINPGICEVRITGALSQAKDIGLRIAKTAMKKTNNFLTTVNSGAKGDFFNIAQLTGLLGQQNLEGKRVRPSLNHGKRTLHHYHNEYENKAEEYQARGFVSSSFIKGLNPAEFFFHAMSGREGVSDTAVKTADSGYTQRKIVKNMEDVQVRYDGTVRDATNRVYQFTYGGNNYDPCKTIPVDGKPQFCNVDRLVNKLNGQFENNIRAVEYLDILPEVKTSAEFISKKKTDLAQKMSELAISEEAEAIVDIDIVSDSDSHSESETEGEEGEDDEESEEEVEEESETEDEDSDYIDEEDFNDEVFDDENFED